MTATPAKKEVTINTEQRLYVIPSGDGYSCWGFDNCYRETCQLAEALNKPVPAQHEIGSMSCYNYHIDLIKFARESKIDLGTWFDLNTDRKVKDVLEAARIERIKVRIFYGDTKPDSPTLGRSWMEEFDVVGHVSRSTGTLKIPILVAPGDDGGPGILTASIIKIIGTSRGITLYEHPSFHVPAMILVDETSQDMLDKGFVVGVDVEGVRHANFKSRKKAQDWVDFMNGRRMTP